jgi:hypothetical protein
MIASTVGNDAIASRKRFKLLVPGPVICERTMDENNWLTRTSFDDEEFTSVDEDSSYV